MSYDNWKARNPEDKLDLDEPPEVWEECPTCCGEGSIDIWESVSKWSIDPPSAHSVICDTCQGAGGFIVEARGKSL